MNTLAKHTNHTNSNYYKIIKKKCPLEQKKINLGNFVTADDNIKNNKDTVVN